MDEWKKREKKKEREERRGGFAALFKQLE